MKGKRKPVVDAWAVLNAHGAMVALFDHKPDALPSCLVHLVPANPRADAVVRAALKAHRPHGWNAAALGRLWTAVDRYPKERKQ